MRIQEKLQGMAYLYLSGQQGLVQHQLINPRRGSHTGFPVQGFARCGTLASTPDISGSSPLCKDRLRPELPFVNEFLNSILRQVLPLKYRRLVT
jgi:hypothetical protein